MFYEWGTTVPQTPPLGGNIGSLRLLITEGDSLIILHPLTNPS